MVARALCLCCCCLLLMVADASASATRTLTDQLGRQVTLPATVQRIIPLGGAARFVVYLQAFDLVVGVEAIEGRATPTAGRPYNLAIRKQAEKLPVVGEGRQKPVNPEAIMALRPDLLITAEADRAQADHLSRLTGVPVLALNYGGMGVVDPDKIKQSLLLLGTALGKQARAAELVGSLAAHQREFDRRMRGITPQAVYVGAISQRGPHGITSTDADYLPLLATGSINLARQLGKQGHAYIDKEQLLVWNPPVILVDGSGLQLVREDYQRHRAFYDRLAAVQHNQVYMTLPYNNYHTNLELALANSWYIGRLLYPSRFADINPVEKTDEICRTFVGIPCYDSLRREFGGFGPLQLTSRTAHAR